MVLHGLSMCLRLLCQSLSLCHLLLHHVHHVVLGLDHVLHLLLNVTELSTIYRRPVVLLVLVPVIIITLTTNW